MKLAMLAQNPQEVRSLVAVADVLRDRGAVEPVFLDLDPFYHQGTTEPLRDAGYTPAPLGEIPALPRSLYREGALTRLRLALAYAGTYRGLAGEFAGAMTGMDGSLERAVLHAFDTRGKATFLLLNGFQFAEPLGLATRASRAAALALGVGHLWFSRLGQTVCTRTFVLGEQGRDGLEQYGVPRDRVAVTGLPRFGAIVERFLADPPPRWSGPPEPLRVLFLGGSWDASRRFRSAEQDRRQVERALAICDALDGVEVRMRPHPRFSEREWAFYRSAAGDRLRDPATPLEEDLREADVVLSALSTGLFEAGLVGALPVSLNLEDMVWPRLAASFAANGMRVIDTDAELRGMLEGFLADRENYVAARAELRAGLGYFVSLDCPRAADLIADEVTRALGG